MSRPPGWLGALAVLTVCCAAGCGVASSTARVPAWRSAHPDQPPGCDVSAGLGQSNNCKVVFQEATGLCQFAVRFPEDAPGVITVEGDTYLQKDRRAAGTAPSGQQIATSGDWRVVRSAASIHLLTPAADFVYERPSGC